jgi:hypothetical protein
MPIAMLLVFVLVLGVALAVYSLALALSHSDNAPGDDYQRLVRDFHETLRRVRRTVSERES